MNYEKTPSITNEELQKYVDEFQTAMGTKKRKYVKAELIERKELPSTTTKDSHNS